MPSRASRGCQQRSPGRGCGARTARARRRTPHLGVAGGGLRAVMAEQHLDHAQIHASLEKPGGPGATQVVMCHVALQARALGDVLQPGVGTRAGHRPVAPAVHGVHHEGREHALGRKQPGALEAFVPPVATKQLEEATVEFDPTSLATLALAHVDGSRASVDVLDPQVAQLVQAHARGQGGGDERVDAGLCLGGLEQRSGLVVGQRAADRRPWNPRSGDALDHLGAAQREQVQEAERRVVDDQGRSLAPSSASSSRNPRTPCSPRCAGEVP